MFQSHCNKLKYDKFSNLSRNSPVSQQGEKSSHKGFVTINIPANNGDVNVSRTRDNYEAQIDKGHLQMSSQNPSTKK